MNQSKIEHKWGFGMSPIKEETIQARLRSLQIVKTDLNEEITNVEDLLEAISLIKGLFNRVIRQDQWDWFTVWQQLGRPGKLRSTSIVSTLVKYRNAIKAQDLSQKLLEKENLLDLGLIHIIDFFLSNKPRNEFTDGYGYIYILSTRENREILKIGYTTRSIEMRVKEINSATGVLIPFGVRALWVVKHVMDTEREIHKLMNEFRIRDDREFFNLDFRIAFDLINTFIQSHRTEV